MASTFAQTYTSFSGADLVVTFGHKTIGELQQISWGIKREKAPVFTLGSPDPRSFSRGKRGIGGSLVFAQFNRDALIKELVDDHNVWERIAPIAMYTARGNLAKRGMEKFEDALKLTQWNDRSSANQNAINQGYGYQGDTAITPIMAQENRASDGSDIIVNVPQGFGVIRAENIMYADMIPPFDVTLTFANEYGQAAFQKIYDVDILDESSGVSVDSIVMERQMSYVARRISPLMEGIYARESGGVMYGTDVVGARIQ